MSGDLVMRKVLHRKSKIHPKWDGPFVVNEATSTYAYQLATANGYILNNLTNVERLWKLNLSEWKQYVGEFWEASSRLRNRDLNAKAQAELRDVEKCLGEVTTEVLEAQQQGEAVSLDTHAELASQRIAIREAQCQARATAEAVQGESSTTRLPPPSRYR